MQTQKVEELTRDLRTRSGLISCIVDSRVLVIHRLKVATALRQTGRSSKVLAYLKGQTWYTRGGKSAMTEVLSSFEHLKAIRWDHLLMQRLNIKSRMTEVVTL